CHRDPLPSRHRDVYGIAEWPELAIAGRPLREWVFFDRADESESILLGDHTGTDQTKWHPRLTHEHPSRLNEEQHHLTIGVDDDHAIGTGKWNGSDRKAEFTGTRTRCTQISQIPAILTEHCHTLVADVG